MRPAVTAALSVVLALFVAFALAFLLTPDPTGQTPFLVGAVLTIVLAPLLYFRMQRAQ